MRPLPWLRHLQPRDVEKHPALPLLAPLDAALEALALALRACHPSLQRHPSPDESGNLQLRRAQHLASLARALQLALVDYHADQLERVRRAAHDYEDIPF